MKLLERFKELSRHPKNTKELKGLILQLAVQGKLTESWRANNPNIEPASELLKRIQAEKQQLIDDKKIKKEKPLSLIEEVPFKIPEGWNWIKLGDLMSMFNGRAFKKHEWSNEGLPIIRIQNLNNPNATFNFFNGELDDKHHIQKGTFLISWSGTPGTSFGAFIWNGKDGALNQHINKCVFHSDRIDEEFYKRAINSQLYKLIEQAQGGVGLKHVTKGILNNLILPLPPLEEQKAIVEVVNTLFKEVEQLESLTKERIQLKESFVVSALNRLIGAENTQQEWNFLQQHFSSFFTEKKNIKSLRETILQLAVQGKLTAKWREYNSVNENATDLLAKIKEEKASLILKRKLKLRKVEEIQATKDMMYNIPETWCWYNFSDVVFFQEGPGIRKWQFRDEGVKLLNVQNIVGDKLVLENTTKHVQLDEFEQKYRHFKVEEGDLLFASSGGSWGKSAWFIDPGYDVMLNTSMIRMCFYGKKWYPNYLKIFVSSGIFIDQMTEQLVGMQPNFGSTHLSRIYIPIPPLEEQKAIVEKVNSLMALCDELEQQIETSQTQIELLMQSCLKEVFEH